MDSLIKTQIINNNNNYNNNKIIIIELATGFESNLRNNSSRKVAKIHGLHIKEKRALQIVRFFCLTVSMLGVLVEKSKYFLEILVELRFHQTRKDEMVRTIVDITKRTSCYVFCCKGKIMNGQIQTSWNTKIVLNNSSNRIQATFSSEAYDPISRYLMHDIKIKSVINLSKLDSTLHMQINI